ncbi:hypothetical protein QJQ45_002367 [Haematococcus lacustris]|nr:hypothetical protein QJQ45_002367 [Haematococcus lacustris]
MFLLTANPARRPTTCVRQKVTTRARAYEYAGRVAASTVVHTGGNTSMAHTSHHTFERPKFPPGTVNLGNYTLSRYLPTQDPALEELQQALDTGSLATLATGTPQTGQIDSVTCTLPIAQSTYQSCHKPTAAASQASASQPGQCEANSSS